MPQLPSLQRTARRAAGLAAAAAMCCSSPAFASYVLSFEIAPAAVVLNDTVTVDVMVANDPQGLALLGFDLLFDPAVLAFQSASGVGFFGNESFTAFSGSPGLVTTLVSDDFLTPVMASARIGTFTFTAISVGQTPLDIDPLTAFAVDGALMDRFDVSAVAGSVTVQAGVPSGVPLPGTALLAGLGLALMGWQWQSGRTGAAR